MKRLVLPLLLSLSCFSFFSSSAAAQPKWLQLVSLDSAKTQSPKLNVRQIFGGRSEWIDSVMKEMTLQEKIGQMLVVFTFSYYQSNDDAAFQRISKLIAGGKIGGIIFSKGDVYEVATLGNRYQSQARFPLLISADMEWGVSMRIDLTTEFPTNMALAASRNLNYAFEMGRVIGSEARALGIHQNYAPDIDLNNNPRNPIINTRAFSESIGLTNEMAAAFIAGTQAAGALATVKHFPGHGDTEMDSHKELPVLNFTRGRLDSMELRPFSAAVRNGVMSVMVGHLAIPAIDSVEVLPATLSSAITTDILRKDMGFRGLVVTDAMSMKGVKKLFANGDAAVRAVQAGNDVILMPPDCYEAHTAIYDAVQSGVIPRSRIDSSVRKILAAKEWLGLHLNRYAKLEDIPEVVGVKAHKALAQKIADSSITLLKNEGNVLPLLRKTPKKKLLNLTLLDNRSCDAGKGFYNEFQNRFSNTLNLRIDAASDDADLEFVMKTAELAEAVVVSCYVTVKSATGKIGLTEIGAKCLTQLSAFCAERRIPLVLVGFGSPYVIMGYGKVPAYLCTYSSAKVCEAAAVKAIAGDIAPQGKLPIHIPALYKFGHGLTYPLRGTTEKKPELATPDNPEGGAGIE